MATTPSLKQHLLSSYTASFRGLASKKALCIAAADAAFYIAAVLVAMLLNLAASPLKGSLSALAVPGALSAGAGTAVLLLWKLLFLFIVLVLFILAAWGASRAVIWALLLGKPVSWRLVRSFAGIFLVWFIIWGIPFYLSFRYLNGLVGLGIAPPAWFSILQYALIVLLFYFTYPVCAEAASSGKVFSSIKNGVMGGITRVPQRVVPFLIMTVTVFILSQIGRVGEWLPKISNTILGVVLFFGLFTWAKLYYVSAIHALDQPHHPHHSSHKSHHPS
ncbi:hypothetical protein HYU19_05270 [Candidatus Woesearchaeota archaeon]|nr:hypothetical protein [Candidatus Woesearchaeota archaeon]